MSLVSLLIALLPALLLVAALVQGHYPGERVLDRLRSVRPPRRSVVAAVRPPWRPRARRRSGQLLADALAGRGPPCALACT